VVLVPEGGDEIQSIKSGLMEIADAFIVNKADRDGVDLFANNLKKMVQQKGTEISVFKTIASENSGIDEIADFVNTSGEKSNSRKEYLLAEKTYKLIQQKRMGNLNKIELYQAVSEAAKQPGFNIYSFAEKFSDIKNPTSDR
jgi:LAO/AO transport system kinase